MTGYVPTEKDREYFARVSKEGVQRVKEFLGDAYSSTFVTLPAHMWDIMADQIEQHMVEDFQVFGRVEIEAEIPADAEKAAREALKEAGHGDINNVDLVLDEAIEIIARAILAERERCIKAMIDAANAGKYTPLSELAAAIRGDQ
ncbi:hypothetical protein GOC60_14565 [Sinorhizobium meliloti]|nr:hypothetical protein [Sinorhizobium meliloti]